MLSKKWKKNKNFLSIDAYTRKVEMKLQTGKRLKFPFPEKKNQYNSLLVNLTAHDQFQQ
jgi:hypothetical protein